MGDINSRAFLSECARSGACVLGVLPPSVPERVARVKNEASESILTVGLLAAASAMCREGPVSGRGCPSQRRWGINYRIPQLRTRGGA